MIGFALLAGISVGAGFTIVFAALFPGFALEFMNALGEMVLAVLAAIAAIFAAIFSIFS